MAEHPVVRVHPETNRKALYVNVAHTGRFSGMTREESLPLLRYLFQHQIRPEFTCYLHWRLSSIALWDNPAPSTTPSSTTPATGASRTVSPSPTPPREG